MLIRSLWNVKKITWRNKIDITSHFISILKPNGGKKYNDIQAYICPRDLRLSASCGANLGPPEIPSSTTPLWYRGVQGRALNYASVIFSSMEIRVVGTFSTKNFCFVNKSLPSVKLEMKLSNRKIAQMDRDLFPKCNGRLIASVVIHTQEYFLNLVDLNQTWIIISLFRLIQHQTEICLNWNKQ